jgi:hypothetical protein
VKHYNELILHSGFREGIDWFDDIEYQHLDPCAVASTYESAFVDLDPAPFDVPTQPHEQQYVDPRDLEVCNWSSDSPSTEAQSIEHGGNHDTDYAGLELVRLSMGVPVIATKLETLAPSPLLDMKEMKGGPPGSASGNRVHSRVRSSAFRDWLHDNGFTSYPTMEEKEALAAAEGKTVQQAQVALSNLRARSKKSKSIMDD